MVNQIIVNILIDASCYILVSISFMLIYQISRFFHFAHGIVFTAGAYIMFLFHIMIGLSLNGSIILGIIGSIMVGCLIELFIYRPLKRKGSSPLILLLASLGIYIILQNICSIVFGNETRSIRAGVVQEGIDILGTKATPIQIITICVSIALVIALSLFQKKTKIGSLMRAVASDPELANISGVNSNRVILWAFALGSALAGLAGMLVACDIDMTPTMGMHALLMGVVVMIIGGIVSIPGIALGALLLATTQHFGIWFIGSQWQDAIAFVILILFLLFKPEGFLGKKVKSATV
jgi:branched-chain amino acid transport system permease protein